MINFFQLCESLIEEALLLAEAVPAEIIAIGQQALQFEKNRKSASTSEEKEAARLELKRLQTELTNELNRLVTHGAMRTNNELAARIEEISSLGDPYVIGLQHLKPIVIGDEPSLEPSKDIRLELHPKKQSFYTKMFGSKK